MTQYFCCAPRRRTAVQNHPTLNGIDFLEVVDRDAPMGSPRQQTLLVRFFKPIVTVTDGEVESQLTAENIQIIGGERITPVLVVWAFPAANLQQPEVTPAERDQFSALPQPDQVLVVRTNTAGDFSTYRLLLTQSSTNPSSPEGFDPLLRTIDFSFKVDCPSDFDCRTERTCPPVPIPPPEIDYLAKDFASFRQLMLDRMALLIPDWQERNPADLGVVLVELLAYVGDYLSYQQDAVATEAYLATARRRVSVRRHARLVDYFMHDGSNARTWVQVQVNAPNVFLPRQETQFFTQVPGQGTRIARDTAAYTQALATRPVVFELMQDALLFPAHNQIRFYTWTDQACCLPQGATQAILRDDLRDDPQNRLRLRVGDVLVFAEQLGPNTGIAADAAPSHRHAVRLTRVYPEAESVTDEEGREIERIASDPVTDPLTGVAIVEIEWDVADALPFPVCISVSLESAADSFIEDVSVALGNIFLADHGLTLVDQPLGQVPEPTLFRVPGSVSPDRCQPRLPRPIPPRYRPQLGEGPLTFAGPLPTELPAAAALQDLSAVAQPVIELNSELGGETDIWQPRRDLLSGDREDKFFVVETETDGTTTLRFGDDRQGERPDAGAQFTATYRVGNGVTGNIGAESLVHIVSDRPEIMAVRHPLPAQGGTDPEPIEDVRQRAPVAFRVQDRAVTPEDYARIAQRHHQVQRAAATFRWTGSWRTVRCCTPRICTFRASPRGSKRRRVGAETWRARSTSRISWTSSRTSARRPRTTWATCSVRARTASRCTSTGPAS